MLTTGHQYTAQNGMSLRAGAGPIAAIGFSGDDGRAQHTFGLVIRGFQVIHIQEAQQMGAMFTQAFGEADIIDVFQSTLRGDQGSDDEGAEQQAAADAETVKDLC